MDFELEPLAEELRSLAGACGVWRVEDLVAITDGGNGLEESLRRRLAEHLATAPDWYHAAEHLCDFPAVLYVRDEAARSAWPPAPTGSSTSKGAKRC